MHPIANNLEFPSLYSQIRDKCLQYSSHIKYIYHKPAYKLLNISKCDFDALMIHPTPQFYNDLFSIYIKGININHTNIMYEFNSFYNAMFVPHNNKK